MVASTLTVSVDASSDAAFRLLPIQTLAVTTTDNDLAGFTVSQTDDSTIVSEAGDQDSFSVQLSAAPLTDVLLRVESDDTSEVGLSTTSLLFTTANWSQPQTVTVSGIDDDLVDGVVASTLTVSVDASSDAAFRLLPIQTLAVTTTDDDASGFFVTQSTMTVDESGSFETFTVVLTAEPTADVVLNVVSADVEEALVDHPTLTFNPTNWNVAQTVTVTGVDESIDDGDQATVVSVSVNGEFSDDVFDLLAEQTVNVTTTDDDAAGFAVSNSAVTVDETGSLQTFTVVLSSEPISEVVLDIVSADVSEVSVDRTTLTFTPANWNVNQTITVTGVNDAIDDGDQATMVTVSVIDPLSDVVFGPLAEQTVNVTTRDDDVAGIGLSQSDDLTVVGETHSSDAVEFALTSQPLGDVVIAIAVDLVDEVSFAPSTLTFTPDDWDVSQEVTFTGKSDLIDDGDQTISATASIQSAGADENYAALTALQWNVTNTDRPLFELNVIVEDSILRVYESASGDLISEKLVAANTATEVVTGQRDDIIVVSPLQDGVTTTVKTAAGNDRVSFRPPDMGQFDGGDGIDTAVIQGDGSTLDLSKSETQLQNVERIDLRSTGTQTLVATIENLKLVWGDEAILFVLADQGDVLKLGHGWTISQPAFDGEVLWHRLVSESFTLTLSNDHFWTNPLNPNDVDRSGDVTAGDALKVINRLSEPGGGTLEVSETDFPPPNYLDTSGDGEVTALDALRVINYLSDNGSSGEGEFVSSATLFVRDPAVNSDREPQVYPSAINEFGIEPLTTKRNIDATKTHVQPMELVQVNDQERGESSKATEATTLEFLDQVYADWRR
ncbi:Dockerin type I repeat protein [Planctomycetes bacterium CA13]|uniref:Dockerin type I repeat protein n=1 Tax=Novipirellula herctigrandis TaxID=2527986 RepID=A0A5C5ZB50_9BACT|nr:Dockerin type I repeat protein [Planctomycetes bacterium CA13]